MARGSLFERYRWTARFLTLRWPGWARALWLGEPIAQQLTLEDNDRDLTRVGTGYALGSKVLTSGTGNRLSRSPKIVDVYVPQSMLLRRDISAPKAAGANLEALARLDLVRRTPFDGNDVVWSLSKSVSASDGALSFTQWVLKKAQIEALQHQLRALGLIAKKIYVGGVETKTPLADFSEEIAPAGRRFRAINGSLFLAALVLIGIGWLGPAMRAKHELGSLSVELAALREQALDLRLSVEALRSADTERMAFLEATFHAPKLSEHLRNLTIAMPDTQWLSEISYAAGTLKLAGESDRPPSEIVLDLAQVPQLSNPRLHGPTQRTVSGKHRFGLAVDVSRVSSR